ncbi:MAG: hypothetical protein ACYDG6_06630 [Thermincolia bacterium]
MEKLMFVRDLIVGNVFMGICALIIVDTLLGIMLAFLKREYDNRKMANYLSKSVLPYIGGLGVIYLASFVNEEIKTFFAVSAAAAGVQIVTQVKDKLVRLTVKVPIE